ncbi:hypothetical protein LK542_11505 [Massilia sp. IC2-477]|uniref:hypothetical protein n=1 Tax=Massilia sp. IC2-477 TaxID=2887198 RepID=UPI001D12ACC4|nr:hypothetical protein [Massilia sp. IC2-477]MCC2956241.1 hypothetical protein [Massilia sp. IC2-477]
MVDAGLLLIFSACAWLVLYGNCFGLFNYSKKVQAKLDSLLAKEKNGENLSSVERGELQYYKLNEFLDKSSYCLLVAGLACLLMSLIFQ